ncbi:5-oxoprolinase subunit PxpA [Marinicella meishanensis]|uniref:5-oxoprolinase subunit PxpA n=1 Tax=Marinicella meishanensis TaxID=2873263 RepID=UPI001CBDB597|nr:5-oxoprolinase subunit PxpA [Marinicella sp. NBU2979]
MSHVIDLNCDLGEYASLADGQVDAAIMPHISSCNVACGGHAGNQAVMAQTMRWALQHGVQIGAHPGYPDRVNFGREPMSMSPRELQQAMQQQLSLAQAVAAATGATIRHIKPHGALYNQAAEDLTLALKLMTWVAVIDDRWLFYGLAHSAMAEAAAQVGLRFVAEGFADRGYTARRTLQPRDQAGALISEPAAMLQRAIDLAQQSPVAAVSGERLDLRVETLCLHGDHPGAAASAERLHQGLVAAGIAIRAPTGAA